MTPEIHTATGELAGAVAALLHKIRYPAPHCIQSWQETENLTAAKQRFDKAMSDEAQNLLKK